MTLFPALCLIHLVDDAKSIKLQILQVSNLAIIKQARTVITRVLVYFGSSQCDQ